MASPNTPAAPLTNTKAPVGIDILGAGPVLCSLETPVGSAELFEASTSNPVVTALLAATIITTVVKPENDEVVKFS